MKVPKRKKRRVWLAGLLSLLWPGLGQIYCGRLIRGISLVIGLYILKSLGVFILNEFCPANKLTLTLYIILLFFVPVVLAIDACVLAVRSPRQYRLKEYNRWYFYLCLMFLLSSSQRDFTGRCIYRYIQPTKIISSSMFPSLQAKDRVVVYKNNYRDYEPKVGDIIEFPHPTESKHPLLKRVVACGGDTVEVNNNQVVINGITLNRSPVKETNHQFMDLRNKTLQYPICKGMIYLEHNKDTSYPIFLSNEPNDIVIFKKREVPPDYVYVMGDNRNDSYDSRYFGPIPVAEIIGVSKYSIWTSGDWDRWGLLEPEKEIYQNDLNSSSH